MGARGWVVRVCPLLLYACLASGCGAGVVGAVLSGLHKSKGGGGTAANAPPTVSGITLSLKRSPGEISFVLTDPESDPLDVEILYSLGSGGGAVPVLMTGPDQDLHGLASSPSGVRHVVLWDF